MFDSSTDPRSRAWVEVRLDRIRQNAITAHHASVAGARLLPMVKADAYGLGLEPVVHTLSGRDAPPLWGFGVAAVSEGEALRRAGWAGRVLVTAPTPPGELERAADAELSLSLSSLEAVSAWAEQARRRGHSLAFHLEIDTGMGRAGFPWQEADRWGSAAAAAATGLNWEGCFTHFHSADEDDLAPTTTQWNRFQEALARLPEAGAPRLVHCANSAATLRMQGFGCGLIRPGIFLYGGRAGGDTVPEPVVSVRSRLVLVRDVPAGSTLGYGVTHVAAEPQRWGTIAIGYGDGISRRLGNRGSVLVHGVRVPIIGRVSMDMITIELSRVPHARPGDVVTLIGHDGDEEITLEEVAEQYGSISYEVLTGLGPRLPRLHLDGDDDAEHHLTDEPGGPSAS